MSLLELYNRELLSGGPLTDALQEPSALLAIDAPVLVAQERNRRSAQQDAYIAGITHQGINSSRLTEVFALAHGRLADYLARTPHVSTWVSGAAVCIIFISPDGRGAITANLGDSRAYMLTHSKMGRLDVRRLTQDLNPNHPEEARRLAAFPGAVKHGRLLSFSLPQQQPYDSGISAGFGDSGFYREGPDGARYDLIRRDPIISEHDISKPPRGGLQIAVATDGADLEHLYNPAIKFTNQDNATLLLYDVQQANWRERISATLFSDNHYSPRRWTVLAAIDGNGPFGAGIASGVKRVLESVLEIEPLSFRSSPVP